MRLNGFKQDRWIEELIDLCNDRSPVLSDGRRLTFLTAARDLGGWLDDPRTYNGMHKPGWQSSEEDFEAAFEVLGPAAKSLINPHITQLLVPMNHLPAALLPKPLPAGDPSGRRADAIKKHKILLAVVESADFLAAAWKDLIEGCKDATLDGNMLKLRRDNLWSVAASLGHDLDSLGMGGRLAGVLGDNAFDIAIAREELGDTGHPKLEDVNPRDTAGLSINDRLDICRRLLLPSRIAHNVIYLCLQDVSLPSTTLSCGTVTFYDMEWLKGNLLNNGPNKNQLPQELIGDGAFIDEHDFPEGQHLVWARVDLGPGISASAPRSARDIVEAILLLTDAREGWKILEGYLQYCDNRQTRSDSFYSAAAPEYVPSRDSISYQIQKLQPKAARITSSHDSMLSGALNARRWLKDVEDAESLSKIVVSVRVLELIASWLKKGSQTWQDFTKGQLQDEWCQDYLIRQLYVVSFTALHATLEVKKEDRHELSAMAGNVVQPGAGPTLETHLDKALIHLPRLIGLFNNTPRVRVLQETSNAFSSGMATSRKLDELKQDFQRMLDRLVRYRNAAHHGGPIVDEVADTIGGFAHSLAMIGAQNVLRALLDGNDPLIAQTKNRDDAKLRHNSLDGGATSAKLFS